MNIEKTVLECLKNAEFTIECEPEDMPVRGNAMASGNDAEDKEAEDWIIDQLNSGNEWAWCSVKATAKWGDIEGVDYLGGCSYKSKRDFIENSSYYEDMRDEAMDDLKRQLTKHFESIPVVN